MPLIVSSHFLFFASLKELYVWVDAPYQYASLMVYPLYYIYFRLLTVDERFSFSKHARYLLPSTILFLFYVVGILLAPKTEYKMWVFDRWGNMIFYSEKLDHAWDGTFQGKSDKVVMQDVYVWKVELKDVFSKKHDYHGTVSVVK